MNYFSVQGTLTAATPTSVFVCPPGITVIVDSIRATNTGAFAFTVKKYVAGSSSTVQLYTLSLSAGDIITDTTPMLLRPGDYLELTSDIGGTTYIAFIKTVERQ